MAVLVVSSVDLCGRSHDPFHVGWRYAPMEKSCPYPEVVDTLRYQQFALRALCCRGRHVFLRQSGGKELASHDARGSRR
jgi:hypothetical protein